MVDLLKIGRLVQQNPNEIIPYDGRDAKAVVIYESLKQYFEADTQSIVDDILEYLNTCEDEEEKLALKLALQNILNDIAEMQQLAETMDMDCQQLIGQFC